MKLIFRSRKPAVICDPKVALSFRKYISDYTGDCILVRRSSDNAEQAFGFVSDVLDTASLLTFCGAGDGFIKTWYDQSGYGINATQTATALQPKIVSGGAMVTLNSLPSGFYDGVDDYLDLSGLSYSGSRLTLFEVGMKLSTDTVNNSSRFFSTQAGADNDFAGAGSFVIYMNSRAGTNYIGNMRASVQVYQSYTVDSTVLIFAGYDGCRRKIALNGATATTSFSSGNFSYTRGRIGAFIRPTGGPNPGNYLGGYVSELILYHCDVTAQKATIEGDINTFYSIY